MREPAPKVFIQLGRSGKMDAFLHQISLEAHQMLDNCWRTNHAQPRAGKSGGRAGAEEIVRATLIEFPTPEKDQNPEPPDDLPEHR